MKIHPYSLVSGCGYRQREQLMWFRCGCGPAWYLRRPKTVQLQKHEQMSRSELGRSVQNKANIQLWVSKHCSYSKLSNKGLKANRRDIWQPSVQQGCFQIFGTNRWSYSAALLAHSNCLTAFCVILTPDCPNDGHDGSTTVRTQLIEIETFLDRDRDKDREGLHPRPDLFWIDWGRHPVCPTICVMFLASHQALLSGNNARRLMCAGGAAEHSANSVQQIWILCHMTAPRGAEKPKQVNNHTYTHILKRAIRNASCFQRFCRSKFKLYNKCFLMPCFKYIKNTSSSHVIYDLRNRFLLLLIKKHAAITHVDFFILTFYHFHMPLPQTVSEGFLG